MSEPRKPLPRWAPSADERPSLKGYANVFPQIARDISRMFEHILTEWVSLSIWV